MKKLLLLQWRHDYEEENEDGEKFALEMCN